jgi:putative transposase
VLNKVALLVQINMKADLREIYGAPTRAGAEAAIDVFADKYGAKYDKAPDQGSGTSCLPSSTFRPSTGTICAPQTRSRAYLRRCVIEPCGPREPSAKTANLMVFKLVNAAGKHGGDKG